MNRARAFVSARILPQRRGPSFYKAFVFLRHKQQTVLRNMQAEAELKGVAPADRQLKLMMYFGGL
jgi:hypothetical protein